MTSTAIPQEMKAEAARTLIERLIEKTALVKLFRHNAAMKHGVPITDREVNIVAAAPATPEPRETVQQAPQPERPVVRCSPAAVEQTVATPARGLSDGWKLALQTLAVLGGGALAATGGYLASRPGTDSTDSTTVVRETRHESPLQFIEDQGAHLP